MELLIALLIGSCSIYFFLSKKVRKEQKGLNEIRTFMKFIIPLIEERDFYTAGHSKRVATYATIIADELNKSKKYKIDIPGLELAGLLHDIGKLVIPDNILLKPSKLNFVEYAIIKEHVNSGIQVLQNSEIFAHILPAIKTHHERFDGSGYPRGLKNNEIPVEGYILSIADTFDAMTTRRIYKESVSKEEALNELLSLGDKWFPKEIVTVAVKALEKTDLLTTEKISYIPKSVLEEARFSYFYKDQLTNVYNKEYLKYVLNLQGIHFNHNKFVTIKLKDFSSFNRKYGWDKGDLLLQKVANFLNKNHSYVFRLFGDNFLILMKDDLGDDFEKELKDILGEVNFVINRGTVDELIKIINKV